MKVGLRLRVAITYALLTALAVAVTYFGIDYVVKGTFGSYLEQRIKTEQQQILSDIPEAFDSLTGWDSQALTGIISEASGKGMSIAVFSPEGVFIAGTQGSGAGMMGMRRGAMMGMRANAYLTNARQDIEVEGIKVGYADITYQNIFLTDADTRFLEKFNRYLLFSGIGLAIFAVAMGVVFADSISKPIVKVLSIAQSLSKGDYSERIKQRSATVEISQLFDGMNSLAEEMGRQDILRKRMAGDISHELKTPITIAKAKLEAMCDGVVPVTKEDLIASVVELDRIADLSMKLEGIARIESGVDALELAMCRLDEVASSSVEAARTLFEAKKIGLSFVGGKAAVPMMLDCARIRRAIDNLLMNALKYTDAGGSVKVSYLEEGGSAVIDVSDTGIGIAEKDIGFIFERLYRADESRNRGTGGMGIGLSLAKSIVEAHGGKLTVASKMGEGSTFRISLPMDKGSQDR